MRKRIFGVLIDCNLKSHSQCQWLTKLIDFLALLNRPFQMFLQIHLHASGVATIEATEVAASVKILNNRLSRPEFWHHRFSTQTLLDSIDYCTTHYRIYTVVLSRAGAHGDTLFS